ncbi:MAG: penicillin-binding transpeptidase domain-containing protein [Candidatus Marinimicrobia bacterium]|nr:penicillin-binding transpeptidase domain-containing protein [Candidatus Neomarinimicrobiota bacterium]
MMSDLNTSRDSYPLRTGIISMLVLLVFLLVISRLAAIQLFNSEELRGYADSQGLRSEVILPERGLILDRNRRILANNITEYTIGGRYIDLLEPENAFRSLAKAFDKTPDYYRNLFKKENSFYILETQVRPDIAETLQADKACHGLKYDKKMSRIYPYQDAAGQVLGFLWDDGSGQLGIEQYYDELLRGEKGYQVIQRDKRGNVISAYGSARNKAAVPGGDVQLTLDIEYQIILEEEIANAVKKTKALSGMGVIMDPRSGEILAMANYPSFNPNLVRNSTPDIRRNRVIADQFEPGSVFKLIPVSAALEKNIFTPESRIYCEKGSWKVKDRTLHDTKEHEWLSVGEILVLSSNIGAAKIAEKVGDASLYEIARKYGFGEASAVGLWGESAGTLKDPGSWSGVGFAQIAMGHGVTVTLLQMANAYSALATGGTLLKPYIVSATFNSRQKKISEASASPVRRVISEKTAAVVCGMLEEAVKSGTGTRAFIDGYHVAGKTGTAQKVIDSKYSNSKYFSSFIGFFPASDPVMVCAVMIDEPAYGLHHGSTAAAPVIREVFSRIINTPNSSGIYKALPKNTAKSETLASESRNANIPSLSLLSGDNNSGEKNINIRQKTGDESNAVPMGNWDIVMPDVRGMQILNAEQKLRALGLQVERNASRGKVAEQYPPAGTGLNEMALCRLEVRL